jgi:hypothetical protein
MVNVTSGWVTLGAPGFKGVLDQRVVDYDGRIAGFLLIFVPIFWSDVLMSEYIMWQYAEPFLKYSINENGAVQM